MIAINYMSIVNGSAVNFYISVNGFTSKLIFVNLNIDEYNVILYT